MAVSLDARGAGRLRTAAAEPANVTFDAQGLCALRAAVVARGHRLGLRGTALGELMVVATELANNVISHGNSCGRLRLWREGDFVRCQVSDNGHGMADPQLAGTRPAAVTADTGRGLWIVRQLAVALDISSDAAGTTVTATMPIAG